jgi:hypothetical protein
MNRSTEKARSSARRSSAGRLLGLLALSLASALGPQAEPARAASASLDLDTLIAEALAEVPPEQSARAIRFLLEVYQGTTGVHAVSPGSLWDHDAANENLYFESAGGYFASDGGFGGCAYAPLHLPAGATVTGLVILFVDDWNGEDYVVELRRKLTGSLADADVLATAASSGASSSHRVATDLTVANGTIDESLYAYFLSVCRPYFGSELHGIYLTYTF